MEIYTKYSLYLEILLFCYVGVSLGVETNPIPQITQPSLKVPRTGSSLKEEKINFLKTQRTGRLQSANLLAPVGHWNIKVLPQNLNGCPPNIILNSNYGRYHYVMNSQSAGTSLSNKEGYIFDKQSYTCYKTFTQGPCPEGTLISGWSHSSLECMPVLNSLKIPNEGVLKPVDALVSLNRPRICPPGQRYSKLLQSCITSIG